MSIGHLIVIEIINTAEDDHNGGRKVILFVCLSESWPLISENLLLMTYWHSPQHPVVNSPSGSGVPPGKVGAHQIAASQIQNFCYIFLYTTLWLCLKKHTIPDVDLKEKGATCNFHSLGSGIRNNSFWSEMTRWFRSFNLEDSLFVWI